MDIRMYSVLQLQCLFFWNKALLLSFSCWVVTDSLWPHGLQPAKLLCPWDFPGKNTGVGWHFLLQGIFQIPGLNPRLLYWQKQSLQMCKCWEITEDELLVSKQGGPDGGCEREIFTASWEVFPPWSLSSQLPACLAWLHWASPGCGRILLDREVGERDAGRKEWQK